MHGHALQNYVFLPSNFLNLIAYLFCHQKLGLEEKLKANRTQIWILSMIHSFMAEPTTQSSPWCFIQNHSSTLYFFKPKHSTTSFGICVGVEENYG